MIKEINFDMDGTIAAFYDVPNWLDYLTNNDPTPYKEAKPLLNFSHFARKLHQLQKSGYQINIISWLSKKGTDSFNQEVTKIKKAWLKKHLPSVHFDTISIIEYGTPKSYFGKGILFDDELNNRTEWKGIAFDEKDILKRLNMLLEKA